MADIRKAPMFAMKNREALAQSNVCGCFQCLKIYPPSTIMSWTDNGETALCPHCGQDMVLPESFGITDDILNKTRQYWLPEREK